MQAGQPGTTSQHVSSIKQGFLQGDLQPGRQPGPRTARLHATHTRTCVSMIEMLLARGSGMTFTTAPPCAPRSLRAALAGVAGRLSRSCRRG